MEGILINFDDRKEKRNMQDFYYVSTSYPRHITYDICILIAILLYRKAAILRKSIIFNLKLSRVGLFVFRCNNCVLLRVVISSEYSEQLKHALQ